MFKKTYGLMAVAIFALSVGQLTPAKATEFYDGCNAQNERTQSCSYGGKSGTCDHRVRGYRMEVIYGCSTRFN